MAPPSPLSGVLASHMLDVGVSEERDVGCRYWLACPSPTEHL